MISRIYSVDDGMGTVKTYKGFDKKMSPASQVDRIAVISWEGEVNIWAIDADRQAESEFIRFITNEYPDAIILGIYKR